jgi:hypothetical protein
VLSSILGREDGEESVKSPAWRSGPLASSASDPSVTTSPFLFVPDPESVVLGPLDLGPFVAARNDPGGNPWLAAS